jgi:hypothetical protein
VHFELVKNHVIHCYVVHLQRAVCAEMVVPWRNTWYTKTIVNKFALQVEW